MKNIDIIFSASDIASRIEGLAKEIARTELDNLLVVSILKGSFVFVADLIRALHEEGQQPEVEFLFLSSYKGGVKSTGFVEVLRDIDTDVRGRNVLLVDDILESGRTLDFAKSLFEKRNAKSVQICVLLDKPVQRAKEVKVCFTGFECPELFVVGYGMDYAHKYRELPYIGALMDEF